MYEDNCSISICTELLELLKLESETIDKQNKIIARLTNETFEQENFIKVLMSDVVTLSE